MNSDVDLLNPANWMPYYDDQSDRRAVPAIFLLNNPDVQGYIYSEARADACDDPWRVVAGVDLVVEAGRKLPIVLEYGVSSEQRVDPDFAWTFISERDFRAHRAEVIASVKDAFDALWDIVKAGNLSRETFDVRAELLRQTRTRYQMETDP